MAPGLSPAASDRSMPFHASSGPAGETAAVPTRDGAAPTDDTGRGASMIFASIIRGERGSRLGAGGGAASRRTASLDPGGHGRSW